MCKGRGHTIPLSYINPVLFQKIIDSTPVKGFAKITVLQSLNVLVYVFKVKRSSCLQLYVNFHWITYAYGVDYPIFTVIKKVKYLDYNYSNHKEY